MVLMEVQYLIYELCSSENVDKLLLLRKHMRIFLYKTFEFVLITPVEVRTL